MTGLNAAAAVEPLHLILRPFADFEADIPEPSTAQVQQFINSQREALRREMDEIRKRNADAGVPADGDGEDDSTEGGEQVRPFVKGPTPEQVKKERRRSAEIYSALCSGTPSTEIIEQLPHRVFAWFTAAVSGEFLNPEAASGAGSSQD